MKRGLRLTIFLVSLSLLLTLVRGVSAAIDPDALQATVKVGNIANLGQMFIFAFNLLRYIGWAGVILGVGLAIFALIYKLFGTESEETMKTVQGYITKAVIIVIAGILLISAGFIVRTVGGLIGAGVEFEVPSEIGEAGGGTPQVGGACPDCSAANPGNPCPANDSMNGIFYDNCP